LITSRITQDLHLLVIGIRHINQMVQVIHPHSKGTAETRGRSDALAAGPGRRRRGHHGFGVTSLQFRNRISVTAADKHIPQGIHHDPPSAALVGHNAFRLKSIHKGALVGHHEAAADEAEGIQIGRAIVSVISFGDIEVACQVRPQPGWISQSRRHHAGGCCRGIIRIKGDDFAGSAIGHI